MMRERGAAGQDTQTSPNLYFLQWECAKFIPNNRLLCELCCRLLRPNLSQEKN